MTFTEAFDNALEKLNKLKNNRITNFAYDEQAYDTDTVDGVTDYDFDRSQNIPVSTPTVIQANETMLKKGFRSQASSLPRMFLNHFFGRTSYNVNKIVDYLISFLTDFKSTFSSGQGVATLDEEGKLVKEQFPYDFGENEGVATLENGKLKKEQFPYDFGENEGVATLENGKLKKEQFPYPFGEASGVATLDTNGRIPASQLAETVVEYKGDWNALTNEPELSDSAGDFGDLYYVSTARPDASGHSFLPDTTFTVGDRILKGRNGYFKISGGSVKSINDIVPNSVGNVSINADNIPFEEGKSIKERFNELPTTEDAVKSVNTVLPDSNGNVTISIPSDLGRKDELGNIFIGDLTLEDLAKSGQIHLTRYSIDVENNNLKKIYGADLIEKIKAKLVKEESAEHDCFKHKFTGSFGCVNAPNIYISFIGSLANFYCGEYRIKFGDSIETTAVSESYNKKDFVTFLKIHKDVLGFVGDENQLEFVFKEF